MAHECEGESIFLCIVLEHVAAVHPLLELGHGVVKRQYILIDLFERHHLDALVLFGADVGGAYGLVGTYSEEFVGEALGKRAGLGKK